MNWKKTTLYINGLYRQSQVRMPNGCGVEWAECSLIIGTGCRVQVFLAWSSIAQSVCQWAFSLLAIWCLRPWWVRILLSAEEDNLSPFDSNIACLCQSIEINNNKLKKKTLYINGLMQERRNSIANALELRLSCTNPSISPSWPSYGVSIEYFVENYQCDKTMTTMYQSSVNSLRPSDAYMHR